MSIAEVETLRPVEREPLREWRPDFPAERDEVRFQEASEREREEARERFIICLASFMKNFVLPEDKTTEGRDQAAAELEEWFSEYYERHGLDRRGTKNSPTDIETVVHDLEQYLVDYKLDENDRYEMRKWSRIYISGMAGEVVIADSLVRLGNLQEKGNSFSVRRPLSVSGLIKRGESVADLSIASGQEGKFFQEDQLGIDLFLYDDVGGKTLAIQVKTLPVNGSPSVLFDARNESLVRERITPFTLIDNPNVQNKLEEYRSKVRISLTKLTRYCERFDNVIPVLALLPSPSLQGRVGLYNPDTLVSNESLIYGIRRDAEKLLGRQLRLTER